MQEITREFGLFGKLLLTKARLKKLFLFALLQKLEIVFVCVGTSKVLGDSFAPLVGDKLLKMSLPIWVFGGTTNNVDARNLNSTLKVVKLLHPKSIVIVVDTLSTFQKSSIGDVVLSNNYVGLNPKVFVKADLFLFGTTTFVGHQNLYAKTEIVNNLSSSVAFAIKESFLSSVRKSNLNFLSRFVNF